METLSIRLTNNRFILSLFIAMLSAIVMWSYGCSADKRPVGDARGSSDSLGLKHLNINPEELTEGLMTSDMFDSIVYLPLETTEKSIIGSITQLEVTDDKYVIWDDVSNAIVIFNKSGHFLSRIDNNDERVKVRYKKIDRFAVDRRNQHIIFDDVYSPFLFRYTLMGEYVRAEPKPAYTGLGFVSLGRELVYYQGYDASGLKNGSHNLLVERDGVVCSQYLSFDTLNVKPLDLFSVDQSFFKNGPEDYFFTQPYDYNVYNISEGNISKSITINFPDEFKLPHDFLNNSKYNGKRTKYTVKNEDVIYAILDTYEVRDKLIFRMFGQNRDEICLFNLNSNKGYTLNEIISDKLAFMLPIHGERILAEEDNRAFISSVSAATLFSAKLRLQATEGWREHLPETLKMYFTGSNRQNPVLTLLFPKN